MTRLDGKRGTILTFSWVEGSERDRVASLVDELPPLVAKRPSSADDDQDDDTTRTLTFTMSRLVKRVLARPRTR